MTEKKDIWDEKPVRPSSETHLMFERRRYSWEYQLKIEYDKLKEKAENWDNLVESSAGANLNRLLENSQKLEAVKEYVEHPFFIFFKEMVETYNHHIPTKGESWRKCSWDYLTDGLMKQLEDMQTDPDRENYMANIGNYAAMIRLKEIMEAEG